MNSLPYSVLPQRQPCSRNLRAIQQSEERHSMQGWLADLQRKPQQQGLTGLEGKIAEVNRLALQGHLRGADPVRMISRSLRLNHHKVSTEALQKTA